MRRLAAVTSLAAVLAGCATLRPPAEELDLAQAEIDSGRLGAGCRRMEQALLRLDVRDPARWDRLGALADDVDEELARRAFDRAETLRWPELSRDSATPLALPFAARCVVTQGNRGAFSHARLADRFAWDFQAVDEAGNASRGGDAPTAFHGFGMAVVAPADGVVERAEDGVPDNRDGRRNVVRAAGNVVVLRHGPALYTHFCHLQNGSVAVRAGQSVRRGDLLARCGCSGNAVEPHLHFVLRTGPTSEDWSVPVRFEGARILRRGGHVDGGFPEEGDVVERAR